MGSTLISLTVSTAVAAIGSGVEALIISADFVSGTSSAAALIRAGTATFSTEGVAGTTVYTLSSDYSDLVLSSFLGVSFGAGTTAGSETGADGASPWGSSFGKATAVSGAFATASASFSS